MKLLTFAHRGEAQTFLKEHKLKSHPRLNELYQGSEFTVLITGEGIYSTLSKLSYALGLLPECEQIINLGICGALDKGIDLGAIIQTRTVYCEDEFKSFTSEQSSEFDLITAKKRALNLEDAKTLSHFAPLVDREAWANAYVAKENNISFSTIKLVSDHITDAQVCELIRDKAQDYSDQLYEYYISNTTQENIEKSSLMAFSNKSLHFTISQKREYTNLINALISKNKITEEAILDQIKIKAICAMDITPKLRTKELLNSLHKALFPFKSLLKSKLDELSQPLQKYGASFKFDKNLEKVSFQFQATIDSDQSKNMIATSLESFPWSDFEKVMKGEFDV